MVNLIEELEKNTICDYHCTHTHPCNNVRKAISLCREELKKRIHQDCVNCVLMGLKICCRDCESYFKLFDEVLGDNHISHTGKKVGGAR